jgi:hypothetical protein
VSGKLFKASWVPWTRTTSHGPSPGPSRVTVLDGVSTVSDGQPRVSGKRKLGEHLTASLAADSDAHLRELLEQSSLPSSASGAQFQDRLLLSPSPSIMRH